MPKKLFIICCCVLSCVAANAQSVLSGRVLENKTRIFLPGISVENQSTKLKAITNENGQFSIAAKTGDILIFSGFSYQPDTLLITDMHNREVFLLPKSTLLNQVTITDTSGGAKPNPNAVQHYDPMFHGQTVVYQRDPIFLKPVGGVIFRLHWYKDGKKRKSTKSAEDREVSEHISKVFTALNISQYVPLKGADMDNFLLLYIPEIQEYKDKRFDLLPYLNACYQNWQTLTPEQQKAGNIFGK